MSLKRKLIISVTALTFVAAAGAAIGYRSIAKADHDEKVTLAQCPEPVQATILAHLGSGTLVEIERTTDHGEVLYEVDARGERGIFEFDVAASGAFRGMEQDGDDDGPGDDEDGDVQVTFGQCPVAVQFTILEWIGDGSINEIERSPSGNFEVDATDLLGQFEFVVSADGTYLGPEDQGDDDGDDDNEDDD